MKKLLLIFLLFTASLSYGQENPENAAIAEEEQAIPMTKDERRLFHLINNMRKDRKVKPLKFSEELYQKAKEYSINMSKQGMIKDKSFETTMEKDTDQAIRFKTIFSAGSNFIEELEESIRKNFSYYRTVINKEYTVSAVAITQSPSTGLYYMSQLFLRKDESQTAYYVEVRDFYKLLKVSNDISFGLKRKSVLEKLEAFVHYPGKKYQTGITSNSVSISLRDKHLPNSYLQLVFSNSTDIFTGVHTKSYFFKYRDYQKERERLEKIYNTPEKQQSPFYYNRVDEKRNLCFWITADEIVEFRWIDKEGVYVTITKTQFGLRYINRYKHLYNLKYKLSMDVYLRVLKEFLARSNHFEVTEFIRNCKVDFFRPEKEVKVVMKMKNEKLEFRYFYNKDGNKQREEFYLNNKKISTWNFNYNNRKKLNNVETIDHNNNQNNKSFDIDIPEQQQN